MGNCLKGFENDDVSLIPNEGATGNNTDSRRRNSAAAAAVGPGGSSNVVEAGNAGGGNRSGGDGGHHNPAHDGEQTERTRSNRSTGHRSSTSAAGQQSGSTRSARSHHRQHRSSGQTSSSTPGTQSLRFFESTQQQSNMSAHAAMVGATSLTEDEQVKLAKRLTIIQHLPLGRWDSTRSINNNENEECVICMCDFADGDELRYLPCMHAYHRHCIDDWLLRYLTCPSCMEPVDSALFSSFDVMPPIPSSSKLAARKVQQLSGLSPAVAAVVVIDGLQQQGPSAIVAGEKTAATAPERKLTDSSSPCDAVAAVTTPTATPTREGFSES